MKQKITLLLLALLAGLGSLNAKTTTTTTILWENSYTDNIAIPVGELKAGATVTVYVNAVKDASLHLFYCLNNKDYTQKAFTDNGGTISQWPWVSAGSESYQFTIAAADMAILNDNTEETGSGGNLMIGSGNSEELTITKITLTITGSETETGTTTVWNDTPHDLDSWSGLQLTGPTYRDVLKNAKKGDVIRITYTSDEAGQINVCYSNYITINHGDFSVTTIAEPATIEFEITTASILERIQNEGIVLNGQNALLSTVDLLTYDDSYDAVAVTIGSDRIATFSSSKRLDFSGTGISVYYASAVEKGIVRLTETETTWDWEGYILVGETGTYDVPVVDEAYYPGGNYLKQCVNGSTVAASTGGTYHYIFAKDNSDNIAFYRLTADHTLGAKKAYLETTTDITPDAGVKGVSLVFTDEVTGICTAQPAVQNNAIYTLSGVRVTNPTRGLYIVGGRKVFLK